MDYITSPHLFGFLIPQRLWNHRPEKALLPTVWWHSRICFYCLDSRHTLISHVLGHMLQYDCHHFISRLRTTCVIHLSFCSCWWDGWGTWAAWCGCFSWGWLCVDLVLPCPWPPLWRLFLGRWAVCWAPWMIL